MQEELPELAVLAGKVCCQAEKQKWDSELVVFWTVCALITGELGICTSLWKNSEHVSSFVSLEWSPNRPPSAEFSSLVNIYKYILVHLWRVYVFEYITLNIRGWLTLFVDFWMNALRCSWCLRIHHLNFLLDCHLVWKSLPSEVCLTFEFCFCSSVQKNTEYVLVFDAFVIVICLASLILCTRSIVLALSLRRVSVCLDFLPPLLAAALSLSSDPVSPHPALSEALDWIRFLWVIVPSPPPPPRHRSTCCVKGE